MEHTFNKYLVRTLIIVAVVIGFNKLARAAEPPLFLVCQGEETATLANTNLPKKNTSYEVAVVNGNVRFTAPEYQFAEHSITEGSISARSEGTDIQRKEKSSIYVRISRATGSIYFAHHLTNLDQTKTHFLLVFSGKCEVKQRKF